ncbi:MAG: LytTR family transcriptional regulator [Steroidobacteraceae bacterium]|jgi:hypothetical protein|nr:LytTR family transcriptional regulator [Steroidobacteraceae bacterium]
MSQRWGRFAATVFLLVGVTLAYLQAGPVASHGAVVRHAFWVATAVATFVCWWLSQWLVVSGRDRLGRRLLVLSSLVATLLFVPASLAIDLLFSLPEEEPPGLALFVDEWLASAVPVFSCCMIASLPAWLSTTGPAAPAPAPALLPRGEVPQPEAPAGPPSETRVDGGLLPSAVRGGVLRATADLQYVHLHSPEGVTTVPGPMHRVVGLLGDHGLEVRRGEWIADRHVKRLKSIRGRWFVLLRDGQQVAVSRRRLAEVKERWGSTRYA